MRYRPREFWDQRLSEQFDLRGYDLVVNDVRPQVAAPHLANGAAWAASAGEVAVFQELGKALTSSLQLDQVLRTIMEKKVLDDSIKAEMTKVIKECKEAFVQDRQAVGAGK